MDVEFTCVQCSAVIGRVCELNVFVCGREEAEEWEWEWESGRGYVGVGEGEWEWERERVRENASGRE